MCSGRIASVPERPTGSWRGPLQALALERSARAKAAMADVLDRQEIDLAEELGDEAVRRALVDVPRRRDLQHLAVVEDRDARRERQGFALVVGDENEGRPEFLVEPLHFVLHLAAQMFVERRKGLIEQEDRRLEDQRAGQRDALLLPARQFRPAACARVRQARRARSFRRRVGSRRRARPFECEAGTRCSARPSCAGTGRSPGTPCRTSGPQRSRP